MLTLSAIAADKWKYYLSIAKEELLSEAEIKGQWLGKGAEKLGLKGIVKKQHFKNVFEGFAPHNRGIKLVRNAGNAKRQAAWDLTFSAPISVSIAYKQLHSQASEKQLIYESHHKALEKTISFLSEHITTRRFETGKGFSEEKAMLVIAAFTHQVSPFNAPLLHTHALLINLCYREDCSTGSINSDTLYVLQKEAGTLYRAELALELEIKLGIELKRKSSSFEIAAIPEGVIKYFSKTSSDRDTRREKRYKSSSKLQMNQKKGQALGFSVVDLFGKEIKRDLTEQIQTLVSNVSQQLSTIHHRLFSDREVLRLVAEEAQCRGIGIELAQAIARAYLASDDLTLVKKFEKSQIYRSNRSPLLLLPGVEEKKIVPITQPSKEPQVTLEPQVLQRSFG